MSSSSSPTCTRSYTTMEPALACCPRCLNLKVPRLGREMVMTVGWLRSLKSRQGLGPGLSYTLEQIHLMEAGRLDICFWWGVETEIEICSMQGVFKCFLNGYCTVVCTHQSLACTSFFFYKPLWNTNYSMQIKATECRATYSTLSLSWHLASNLCHADRPYLPL